MFTSGFFEPSPVTIERRGIVSTWAFFGPEHLMWLAACALCGSALVLLYQRLPGDANGHSPRRRMRLAVAAVPLVLLLSQDLAMVATNTFTVSWWPLHSCNLCELLCLVYALLPASVPGHGLKPLIGEVLFTLGLTGAAFALLFPGWYYCDAWSWPSLCGFAEHSLIIVFVIMLLVSGELQPRLQDLWKAVLFSAACAAAARVFNARFGTNFFFVSSPMLGTPLVAFEQVLGNPGYLVPFAALVIALWWGEHLLWDALHARRAHQKRA